MKSGGSEIVPLRLVSVGEGYRFDPKQLLGRAMDKPFTTMLIIGEVEGEEDLYIVGSENTGESLILMEFAKLQMLDQGGI